MDKDKSRKRRLPEPMAVTPSQKRANKGLGDSDPSCSGDEKMEAEYSGMMEPPLIKQLKRILSEYPDNGQIIKELIQNAEDAGASEVQVIYDERNINKDIDDTASSFTKFFKGPALCVTNDALFTENDWKGIKMIASSVKEDNKLKVGRFGMGFKSVFHMTDYPCIISGDRILFIDPTGASNKINAEMKLKILHRYNGMDVGAFYRALKETVGIDEDVVSSGYYEGTVFWFPLRETSSEVSRTIYTREKTMSLFMSFANDASETLLFLCHLVSVSLKIRNDTSTCLEEVVSVAIDGNVENIRKERRDFRKSIEKRKDFDHDPITCTFTLPLKVSRNEVITSTEWLIMQYYMGNNSSERLQELTRDPDLGVCPLVGLALPVNKTAVEHFDSRIFCFLPLPREGAMQTGLPVHVNAFFALNQSRHHLKWSTDDQRDQAITDRDILWNEVLIDECLTECYKELILEARYRSNESGNSTESIDALYRSVPEEKGVVDKWKRIPDHLRRFLHSIPIMHSKSANKFVTIETAQFAQLRNLPIDCESSKADIIETIQNLDVPYVQIESDTYEKLAFYSKEDLKDLTPKRFEDILTENLDALKSYPNKMKYSILRYLLSSESYSFLKVLPLLHVSCGEWRTLDSEDVIYLCPDVISDLFPTFEDVVVTRTAEMGDYIWDNLAKIASNENMLKLQRSNPSIYQKFLLTTLQDKVGTSYIIKDMDTFEWFKRLWGFLDKTTSVLETKSTDEEEEVRLVPEIKQGTWDNLNNIILQLHPVSSYFLEINDNLSLDISDCFRALGVTLLKDLPSWFPKQTLAGQIYSVSEEAVDALLNKISLSPMQERIIKSFSKLENKSKDAFVEYLSKFTSFSKATMYLLQRLEMFQQVTVRSPESRYLSVSEATSYVTENFPIELPGVFLKVCTDNQRLLVQLGASEMTGVVLVEMILKAISDTDYYNQIECETFMQYFINAFSQFQEHTELVNIARTIPFLRTEEGEHKRPCDLFNPESESLNNLFIGENGKFPSPTNNLSQVGKLALTKLGLKDINGLCASDIVSAATLLNSWQHSCEKHEDCCLKSTALLQILNNNSKLLNEHYESKPLIDVLKDLNCVISIEKPHHLPASLPSFRRILCKPFEAKICNETNEFLVGSTVPLVKEGFDSLANIFGWNSTPTVEEVVGHLILIKEHCRGDEKIYILPMLSKIYRFLSNVEVLPASIRSQSLVWTEEHFESPENIIIEKNEYDVETLKPYFFTIPPQFKTFSELFKKLGCHRNQSVQVLQKVLEKIEIKHTERQTVEEYERDCRLTIDIIEKLAERNNEITGSDVLLPIQSIHTNRLSFQHASKCTADKNGASYEPSEGDNSIVFVNERIPIPIAKILGAKPLNKQILSFTESMGIQGFGQKEKLTDRLKKLVEEGYKDGVSVPKELIQNADDAGATVVKFLYDERENEDLKSHLFSNEMTECQGPSVFVFNDACFSKSDFENITKLNGATKEKDASKIGRFGLGFCAVYNLTDVPSFVSKASYVIFDPHERHIKDLVDDGNPGIKIDFRTLENQKLLKIYRDQFEPFQNIFGFETASLPGHGFDGTLFRFPLRTFGQSKRSDISRHAYNKHEVQELLSMFIKDVGNMLLFTQNVNRIELHHIPQHSESSENQVLLFEATKSYVNHVETPLTVLQRVNESLIAKDIFKEVQKVKIELHKTEACESLLPISKDLPRDFKSSWVVVWETGNKASLELSEHLRILEKRALPLSAAAVLCDSKFSKPLPLEEAKLFFYDKGRFFCFLPLPMITNLNVHINGSFEVTSDRQRLAVLTDDDKTSLNNTWNESLLEDASVSALFTLLETFGNSTPDCYHQLWPVLCETDANPFRESFFKRIIHEDRRLFYGQGKFVSFSDVIYLDPKTRYNSDIGKVAFEMLINIGNHEGKVLVDIPSDILEALKVYHDISNSCILESRFLELLLRNIDNDYWNARKAERTRLIVYALKSTDNNILKQIAQIRCIPVQPSGICKRPCELVDEEGMVSSLFSLEDEVFPQKDFKQKRVLEKLRQLGMMTDIIPDDILNERCSTVSKIAEHRCTRCALERCHLLIQYIARRKCVQDRTDCTRTSIFADKYMLPILPKPITWQFTWHSDTDSTLLRRCCTSTDCEHTDNQPLPLILGKPSLMFSKQVYLLGGTVVNMIDEDSFNSVHNSVLQILGVKTSLPTDQVVKHMENVALEYGDSSVKNEMYLQLSNVFDEVHNVLQQRLLNEKDYVKLNHLNNSPIILIGKALYAPGQVVFDIEDECTPHLNRLPIHKTEMYKPLFKAMGVRTRFTAHDVTRVLRMEKQIWKDLECKNIDTIIKLLHNLDKLKGNDGELFEYKNDIVAPDISGRLYPIHELVIADDSFKTKMDMHIVHKSVPPLLAERLGAKHKKRKCYERMRYGKPFGQKEKLVSRLGNLINAYPCDSSIIKELLQNADDAEATEINIIKDYRYHSTNEIFDATCEHLQGPSLCVFNNAYFTEDDLQGIQDLGEGSKRSDPSKTGQYGVGFNAVYHLTDTPSFMTKGPGLPDNGLLCIFDPTCKHLPGVESDVPGEKYEVTSLQSDFPGVLLGYLEKENVFKKNIGTLFRLPLRKQESEISRNIHSPESVDAICNEMISELFDALLFVKHVKSIRISNVSSGRLIEEYCIKAELTDVDSQKRNNFYKEVKEISHKFKHDKGQICNLEKREIGYMIKLFDTTGRKETFSVQLRFGFETSTDVPESVVKSCVNGDLGCLPLGGVAFRTSGSLGNNSKAFCFLPLPGNTHLPVHVNGHFALDHESRRDLWRGGYKQEWNECLIKNIIVPAYIECMNVSAITLVSSKAKTPISILSDNYHKIFPIYDNVTNKYWKFLITHLYRLIVSKQYKLFPVFKDSKCHLVALGKSGDTGLGYFSYIEEPKWVTLPNQMTKNKRANDRQRETVLKQLGMKVIQTPLTIKLSIKQSGTNDLAYANPNEVLSFIASNGHIDSHCSVGMLDSLISETKFKTNTNLLILLSFVMKSRNFMEQLPNLPMSLTADGRLNKFSKERLVYCSELSWMFPASQGKFVHTPLLKTECLRPVLKDMIQHGYMHELRLNGLIKLISTEEEYRDRLQNTNYVVTWDKCSPNSNWLASLWIFLFKESQKDKSMFNPNPFRKNALELSDWCFLPASKDQESMLVQIKMASLILDIQSFSINEALYEALGKLPLFSLDISCLIQCDEDQHDQTNVDTYQELQGIVTSYSHPDRLLDCLSFLTRTEGPELIRGCCSKEEDAISILKYFSEHVQTTKLFALDKVKEKLLSLPLYVSMNSSLVQLDTFQDIYIIPSNLPMDGLQSLVDNMNVVFLSDNTDLSALFQFLSLSKTDVERLYADVVLPQIRLISQEMWLSHISYIKQHISLFEENDKKDWSKMKIANSIRDAEFIETPSGYKKCSEFYSHNVPVFRMMCDQDQFLPPAFRTEEWMHFITQIGLKTQVSDELMIKFAEQIENSKHTNLEKIGRKSKELVNCIRNDLGRWHPDTLRKLKSIRFIVPANIPKKYKDVFPQRGNAAHLICMNGSVENKHWRLCWTTLPILPFDFNNDNTRTSLGIQQVRGNLEVIKHFQNISTEMQNKIDLLDPPDITELLRTLYECFDNQRKLIHCTDYISRAKTMLLRSPIIHLPDESKMVCVSDVILRLPVEDELKPFLFNMPFHYGQFAELFKTFGVSSALECYHCLNILFKVQIETKKKVLLSQDFRYVKEALSRLNKILNREQKHNENHNWGDAKLFLPNKDGIMCESTELVVCDNNHLRQRMTVTPLNYFFGFSELQLPEIESERIVKMLPKGIRPKLLTDIVKERFDTSRMEVVRDSFLAARLSLFVHSPVFIVGICRIIKKFTEEENGTFERSTDIKVVKETIMRINIHEVEQLETILQYNGQVVHGSNETRVCFCDRSNVDNDGDKINFYFKMAQTQNHADTVADVICSSDGLPRVIVNSLEKLPYKAEVTVLALLRRYDEPRKVEELLDQERFPPLDFETGLHSISAFPKPGTYVEEIFHPFLEQAFDKLFEESEFMNVALELDDDYFDSKDAEKIIEANSVFIYVHILREIKPPSGRQSVVNTRYVIDRGGESPDTVAAFRLYRFVRRQATTTEVSVYAGDKTELYLPFDENSRRIENVLREAWLLSEQDRRRLIRRLILQWHPDKNIGNEEEARRIFDFIKAVIKRLTEAEQSGSGFTSGYYFHMFNTVSKTAKKYARAYRSNLSEYNMSYNTGNFSHISASLAVVRDPHEAKRWMKQAKLDFQAATAFFEEAEEPRAYNWICYTCHQASEKALKAAGYATNANQVSQREHNLRLISQHGNSTLQEHAAEMQSLVGHHTRMRYPHAAYRHEIPSEIFTKEDAEKVKEIAWKIIEEASELI